MFAIRRLVTGLKICRVFIADHERALTDRGIRPQDGTLIQSMNQ
jgi:hypothetical protein